MINDSKFTPKVIHALVTKIGLSDFGALTFSTVTADSDGKIMIGVRPELKAKFTSREDNAIVMTAGLLIAKKILEDQRIFTFVRDHDNRATVFFDAEHTLMILGVIPNYNRPEILTDKEIINEELKDGRKRKRKKKKASA